MSKQRKKRLFQPRPTGAALIAIERGEQIVKHKYGAEHDDRHVGFELTTAAISYARDAMKVGSCVSRIPPVGWPFESEAWKPSGNSVDFIDDASAIKMLAKAGAFIAAEIDRLLRKKSLRGGE